MYFISNTFSIVHQRLENLSAVKSVFTGITNQLPRKSTDASLKRETQTKIEYIHNKLRKGDPYLDIQITSRTQTN